MSAIIHFGTDGWRARLDDSFTDENVARIADAAARYWSATRPGATVYVGFDTRPAAPHFASVAAQVMSARGLVVKVSDRPVPAPAVSWALAHDVDACGGLIITGSHHPKEYLGIKLRVSDGGGGTTEFFEELEEMIDHDAPEGRGEVQEADITTPYLEKLTDILDVGTLSHSKLSLVVDPMYGAARGYLKWVLAPLGVQVHEIHSFEESGWEDLRPEPIEPWVDAAEREVLAQGVHAGLITDGDADRVGAVDERGRFVKPHKIIALLIGHLVVNHGLSGSVVLNLASSVLSRRVAAALGCRMTIKPIGFKYIYEEMLKGDVLLGGEDAGGIGVPGHLMERDGVLCSLLLCELMARTGRPLGDLADELDATFGTLYNARRDLRLEPEIIEMLRTFLPGLNPPEVAGKKPVSVSHLDGLRLEFEDESWLLLRPSGTEALVRVYAEAPSLEARDALLDAACDIARGAFS